MYSAASNRTDEVKYRQMAVVSFIYLMDGSSMGNKIAKVKLKENETKCTQQLRNITFSKKSTPIVYFG